jgi:hypothetical protein
MPSCVYEDGMDIEQLWLALEDAYPVEQFNPPIQVVDQDGKNFIVTQVDDQGGEGSPVLLKIKPDTGSIAG